VVTLTVEQLHWLLTGIDLDGEHIPSFDTILKVTKALGIHPHAAPA